MELKAIIAILPAHTILVIVWHIADRKNKKLWKTKGRNQKLDIKKQNDKSKLKKIKKKNLAF